MPRRPSVAAIPRSEPVEPSAPGSRSTMHHQLTRLQQRQMEMMEETTRELDRLRQELENNDQHTRLQAEVDRLRQENNVLHNQVGAVRSHLRNQQDSWQEVIGKLQEIARTTGSLEQVFELATTPEVTVPATASKPDAEGTPASTQPKRRWFGRRRSQKSIPAQPVEQPVFRYKDEDFFGDDVQTTEPETTSKPRKRRGVKRLAVRFVTLALITATGYAGWNWLVTDTVDSGSVAGASTETLPETAEVTPTFDTYTESFAEVPFEQTEWEKTTDYEFGLSLDYPKNATNRVRVIGGSNLWFLRKNGYLLKISVIPSSLTLTDWWKENQETYASPNNLKVTEGSFKDLPAVIAESRQKTATSGTSYFIKRDQGIFHIWIKDEPAITDDGQRLGRMVESLTFTN